MKKSKKLYIAVSWLLVTVCMGIIFYLSAQNGEESSELSSSFVTAILEYLKISVDEGLLRSFAHMLEFTGFAVLLFNAVYSTWNLKITPAIAFAGTVAYAITDEIHQIFVPGRAFQLTDILVDSAGALIGTAAAFVILKIILLIKKRGNKNGSAQTL